MSFSGGVGLPFSPGPAGPVASAPASVALSPYWVLFYERDHPARQFRALLGETPPTPGSSGGGGTAGDYDVVQLPKRASVTIWRGRSNLLLQTIPIIVGHAAGGLLAIGESPLAKMHRPDSPTVEPPVVKVRSPGTVVPYQQLDYVVTDLAWGEAFGGLEGNRVMQKLTVTLLEHRADEVLQQEKAAKPNHRGRSYVVKRGDTLTSIARRFKVKGGWRAVGDAQHPAIRDPRKLRVGQRLLIP